ncbi:uncharacterized protein DEA37_0002053 [Paragonimus westermani]|uniref:Uncharacterized protein n=1 Tax=Paragonimus westermani TaxID=34504 RepID=A0A5J4NNA3_9TREM|nr:uncharacterized protein DEA37_0002053 [Paragonimus westermani]
MSAVRPSGTAQSRTINQQIWPAVFDDTPNSSNPQELWDDSELVAHYDCIDAFVKQKLSAIYTERTRQCPVRQSIRTKRRSTSQVHHPSRDPSRNNHTECGLEFSPNRFSTATSASRQHPGDPIQAGYHQPNALHGLEVALQSSPPNNTFSCDFEWLPPILHPPDELFGPKLSTTCSSTHHSNFHTRILPRIKRNSSVTLSNVSQLPHDVLQRWFEAGYNLGREHALQNPLDVIQELNDYYEIETSIQPILFK